jgi:transcriptional regulator with XRE-family HTH domain
MDTTPETPKTPEKVGEHVNQYMREHGISQVRVAKRAGQTTYWVNRVLHGHTKATLEEWIRLADAASVPPYLLGGWLFNDEFADEAEDYISTQDDAGAYQLRVRVEEVISEEDVEVSLLKAADQLNWTVGAAAFIAHQAITKNPLVFAMAAYFYGRVLQDLNHPIRAQWALETARRIAGPDGTVTPYAELSLANLAIERDRIPEGIGVFQDIRNWHERGVRVLTVPRQLAHLHGFGPEAELLRDIEVMRAAWASEPTLLKHEANLTNAITEAKKANRPTWERRFNATRGLVLIGRGDVKRGLEAINASVTAYTRSSHSPADVDAGAYSMALHVLAYILAKLPVPSDVKKSFKDAERLAMRDGIFVVMRICRLARKFAPTALTLMLFALLCAPSIALAGNGCGSRGVLGDKALSANETLSGNGC